MLRRKIISVYNAMRLSFLLPYFLMLPALVAGAGLGWLLRSYLLRSNKPLSNLAPDGPGNHQRIQEAEADLAESEARLAHLNRALASTREQLAAREVEHQRQLAQLRERRTDMSEAAAELNRLGEELKARQQEIEQVLSDINRLTEELDMLHEIDTHYRDETDRLTQHIQWQDGERARFRQTISKRSADIAEAEALLAQRDAELERLIRNRQQREAEIRVAIEQLQSVEDESERLRQTARLVPMDDLTRITGLDDTHAGRLREAGILSFAQLARSRPSELEALLGPSVRPFPDVRRWIAEAHQLSISGSDSQNSPLALPPPTS